MARTLTIDYEHIDVDDPSIIINGQVVGKMTRREVRALCKSVGVAFDPAAGKQELLECLRPLSTLQAAQRLVAEEAERMADAGH